MACLEVGKSSLDKLRDVRSQFEKHNAYALVVNMLDEVAWLFNLRASDIDFNPGELIRIHVTSIAQLI